MASHCVEYNTVPRQRWPPKSLDEQILYTCFRTTLKSKQAAHKTRSLIRFILAIKLLLLQ